jgi:mannitol/fructose-specific phosphotransferase system IIA component (Ntr-type)
MKISEILRREFIQLDIEAATKEDAIHQLAQLAKGHPNLGDFPSFCRALYEREASGSTAIGHGVAIPHARTDQAKDIFLIMGRLRAGVKFEPHAEESVRLLFLIGIPKRMVAEYLRLVGILARQVKLESFRERLLAAAGPDDVIQAFVEVENATA